MYPVLPIFYTVTNSLPAGSVVEFKKARRLPCAAPGAQKQLAPADFAVARQSHRLGNSGYGSEQEASQNLVFLSIHDYRCYSASTPDFSAHASSARASIQCQVRDDDLFESNYGSLRYKSGHLILHQWSKSWSRSSPFTTGTSAQGGPPRR